MESVDSKKINAPLSQRTLQIIDGLFKKEQEKCNKIFNEYVEEAKKKRFLLPVHLLHLMLRHGDNVMGDFFDQHLSQTIDSYVSQRKAFYEQFKKVLHLGTEFTEMARRSVDDLAKASPYSFFHGGGKDSGKKEE